MHRIIIWLFFLASPVTAFADGMVIPPVAFPAQVTIPDQRALIHFTNGVERLVIETRFTGEGTNFAWVVPLPSQPVVEEASTGVFPTLQYLFRLRIVHSIRYYYPEILLLLLLVCMVRFSANPTVTGLKILLTTLLFAFLAAAFFPALSASKGSLSADSVSGDGLSILDRKIVGVFETTTIASTDARAFQTWLTENGFVLPTNSEPVIASYVKDGWVFVAAKVNRDAAAHGTSTPHPLSFTFKTDKPVYPMRLTGPGNDGLRVELYVFGSARAEAKHFKVERCTRPDYPEPPLRDAPGWDRRVGSPENPEIVHPLLRQWVLGSPVATKLTGTLSAADMRDDVWLEWTSFAEKKNRFFSRVGASTIALNWASGFLAVATLAGLVLKTRRSEFIRWSLRAICITAASAGLIYLLLPRVEARIVRRPSSTEFRKLTDLQEFLLDTNSVTRAEISSEARRLLSNPTNDVEWVKWAAYRNWENWDNDLLGGSIHEEDSPGNFTLHQNGDELEFIIYDSRGSEHVMWDTWKLRR
jgi:hypothetical protein